MRVSPGCANVTGETLAVTDGELQLALFTSLGAGARGGHLRGCHRFAVIAPRAALEVDDVGDFGIAEHAGKWRHGAGVDDASHRAPRHSIEDCVYVFSCIVLVDDTTSFERRKHAGQTFAIDLMAGRAVGDI